MQNSEWLSATAEVKSKLFTIIKRSSINLYDLSATKFDERTTTSYQ